LNLDVFVYVFEISDSPILTPSTEVEYLKWVSLDELETVMDRKETIFKIKEGIIWGLTARIIQKFIEMIESNTKEL